MLHRRQFLLGPRAVRSEHGWRSLRLDGAGVLSHCPDLTVRVARDAEQAEWCLIGLAVQSDPARPDPDDEIRAARTAAIPALTRAWAGRWLLVGAGHVYPDAAALRPCFFRRMPDGCWASSSAALLAEHGGAEADPRLLAWGKGIEWYPPPESRFAGVRRLLPSQALELAACEPVPWGFLPRPSSSRLYGETIALLEARLVTALTRLPAPRTLWLPTTAGIDSRVLLAIASHLGRPFQSFTHERPHLPIADRFLPPKLARSIGAAHRFVRPGRFSAAREKKYDAHTGRQSVDADRGYYARGQWNFLAAGDVVVHGGCFEVGRCFYYRRFPEPAEPGRVPAAAEIAGWLGEPADSSAVAGLEQWVRHAAQHPLPWLDWRDRFYIEQRLAGWLSSLEHSLDLIDATRYHPANAAETFSLLLEVPRAERATGEHQRELVRRLAPALLELPVNPAEGEFPAPLRIWHRLRQDRLSVWRSVLKRLGAPRV